MSIPVADLVDYLKEHGLRIVKSGWDGDEFVVVVAPVEEDEE